MLPGTQAPRTIALLFLVALVVIWGGNYTWVKIAVRDIGPWTFNLLRYAGAVLLMWVAVTAVGRGADILPLREERAGLAVVGLLQAAVITSGTALALQWIEASRVVLIAYSMPIWTLPLSVIILNERAGWATYVGALLGFAGLLLLTNPLAMTWSAETIPGLVAALIAVLGWALGAVLYRRRQWRSNFWQQTFWQLLVTALALLPLPVLFEIDRSVNITTSLVVITLYNCIVPTVLGYWCWAQALTRVPATAASQVLLLSPVFGMVQSHLVLGEPLGAWIAAAALCILTGAWLAVAGARN